MADAENRSPVPIQLLQPTQGFVAGTYAASVTTLVVFTFSALMLTRRHLSSHEFSLDSFLTARGSSPWLRIGWSFFAGAMGAWAIGTPAYFAATTGYITIIAYALSSGLPILLVAFFGEHIQALLPRPLSLSDFVLWRYGRAAQIFVAFLCIFNMSMAIISEYSVIGSIFKEFLMTSQYPIIVLVAVLTMAYTIYGGLLISIITDQFQGAMALLLTVVLIFYLTLYFRPEFPPFPNELLGATAMGWQTCFILPVSLTAATFFSEANWQRVWAAESRTALRKGAIFATVLITLVIALYGLTGLLSTWVYNPVAFYTNANQESISYGNLFMFYVLGDKQYTWIGALIVILAVIMNESAVDTLQNALTATITANLFRSQSVNFTRILVLILNIPLAALGFLSLPALNLFLITNILTTCAAVPLISGLFDVHRRYISGYSMIFSSTFAIVSVTVYGIIQDESRSFVNGFIWTWWLNQYNIYIFVTALVSSIVGVGLWVGIAMALYVFAGIEGQKITPDMINVLDNMKCDQATESDAPFEFDRLTPDKHKDTSSFVST